MDLSIIGKYNKVVILNNDVKPCVYRMAAHHMSCILYVLKEENQSLMLFGKKGLFIKIPNHL